MVKHVKTDVNKKNVKVGKTEINFFSPKLQQKIFIIVDEMWVKHNCSYGNYPKYHMPLITTLIVTSLIIKFNHCLFYHTCFSIYKSEIDTQT